MTRKVARIFEDVGGWYVCDDSQPTLDTRGQRFNSRTRAINHIRWCLASNPTYRLGCYTHYLAPSGRAIKLGP